MGLAYVAPVGVQNLFVMHAALTLERRRAMLTALTVIFFDVTLALACFWWAGAAMQHYPQAQKLMLIVGSLVVLYIGQGLLRAGPAEPVSGVVPDSWGKTCVFACVVTWFNPQAVIDGTMMLGAFHALLADEGATAFMAGVVTASITWFLTLTVLLSLFRTRFSSGILRVINMISGIVIVAYGGRLLYAGVVMP